MASIEVRHGKALHPGEDPPVSYRIVWRNRSRGGMKETVTVHDEQRAKKAKSYAEAHDGRITGEEVEAVIVGLASTRTRDQLPTVADWSETWLASRTRISSGQRGRYRQQLRDWILPAIGHLRLDQVDGSDIAKILNKLAETCKPGTVTRYYSCIHAMFEYAVKEKKIGDNPAKRTDFIRDLIAEDDATDDGEGHVYLSMPQYLAIRRHLQPLAQPLTDYMIQTGARYSEATAASVGSVLLDKRAARIHRAWKRLEDGSWQLGPTKGRGKRAVPFGTELAATLKPYLDGRKATDLLFVTPAQTGNPKRLRDPKLRWDLTNFLRNYWAPAVAAAMRCGQHPPELPAKPKSGPRRKWRPDEVSMCDCPGRLKQRPTPHDLRHSYVALMLAAGRPLAAISRRLGHYSVTLTERVYAGILPEVDELDGAVMDAALGAAVKPRRRRKAAS
jgi:integrase